MTSSPNVAQQDFGTKTHAAAMVLDDAIEVIPGLLASMLVALGRNGINTVEDLAGCATEDLTGWTECRGDEITRHPGILDDMIVSRKECDAIILHARIRAGWIDPAGLTI